MKKNYLIIENGTVSNIVVWDGDIKEWSPPTNSIAMQQDTTPAIVWCEVIENEKIVDYTKKEIMGVGQIGFIWDGFVLATNEPKPTIKD